MRGGGACAPPIQVTPLRETPSIYTHNYERLDTGWYHGPCDSGEIPNETPSELSLRCYAHKSPPSQEETFSLENPAWRATISLHILQQRLIGIPSAGPSQDPPQQKDDSDLQIKVVFFISRFLLF